MIQITCTSCKRGLSIDDAFAGGVCRCQYCGAIQTVPGKGQKAAAAKGPKTLFENKARGGVGSGSGLEDLADVVLSSSGLSDPNLRKPLRQPPAAPAPQKNLMTLLGISAAVIVVLLGFVLVLLLRGTGTPSPPGTGTSVAPAQANGTLGSIMNGPTAAPSFCGVTIDQPVVVFLIDNGSSSAEVLDAIKESLYKALASLGPDRRFQVLFWNLQTPGYPSDGLTYAVAGNVDAAKKKLQDASAEGRTELLPALHQALGDEPGQIIIVTAKAGDLDDALAPKVAEMSNGTNVHIDCIAINGVSQDQVLQKIAERSGGKFVALPEAKLRQFAF